MLVFYVVAHIVGGACLSVAGLAAVDHLRFGPLAPAIASAAFAIVGLGLIFSGHFAT